MFNGSFYNNIPLGMNTLKVHCFSDSFSMGAQAVRVVSGIKVHVTWSHWTELGLVWKKLV